MHSGKLKPGDVDAAMIRKVGQQLMKAAFTGYGKSFDTITTNKDFVALKQIEGNVYVFSGFKNYQQLKETSLFLKDDDGNFKSFKDFLSDVKKVDATYNEVYADAEYDTAISSAQGIATWQQIMADIKHSPNLTYRTSGGDVCPICAPLDGLTFPADSPFWDKYYIPNHFRCNCDTEQNDDEVSDISMDDLPDLAPMFNNNVGKNGVIFPDSHPYFQDVPKADRTSILKCVSDVTPERKYKGDD
jgi:hypothetical protein